MRSPGIFGIALLVSGAASFRQGQKSTARAIELYTVGCPKMSSNLKKWPREGCFQGLRAETEDYQANKDNAKDVVTWLLSTYRHSEMKTVRLFGDPSRSEEKPCHWNRAKDNEAKQVDPNVALHDLDIYINRSMAWGGQLGVVADVGLRYSYEIDPPLNEIRQKGWGVVGKAVVGNEEVSHLLQNPDNLECILTFEGTDRTSEWFNNIDLGWKTFCGNGFLHGGFIDVLLNMCTSNAWQSNIRPKLGFCSKLSVTGHSLGGAMAGLYVGCVVSKKDGRKDYENLKFDWKTPKKLTLL